MDLGGLASDYILPPAGLQKRGVIFFRFKSPWLNTGNRFCKGLYRYTPSFPGGRRGVRGAEIRNVSILKKPCSEGA